jgi:hypothetical protein
MPSAIFAEPESGVSEKGVSEEVDPETLTKPERLQPQRQKLINDTLHNRIIVISPDSQFNAFFESQIPELIVGGYVDIVDRAELIKPPYLYVADKEKNLQKPFWIIDFQRIVAKLPSEKHLSIERARALSEILEYPISTQESEKLFSEYLQQETDATHPELRINSILKRLIPILKERLSSNLEEKLKQAYEITLRRHPVDAVVPFNLYEIWNRNAGAVYITPSPELTKELESQRKYDEEGNFLSSSVAVQPYVNRLKQDLTAYASAGYWESLGRLLIRHKRI